MKSTISIFIFFCLTFSFTKNNFASDNDSSKINVSELIEPEIFDRAEVMPKYSGGVIEMMKYLTKNLKYPADAKQFKFQGRVIVKFCIDIDGSVKDPIVLYDKVGGGADIEAIRLVKAMPKWIPGTQNGKPVKVYYTLPINFSLH